MPEWITPLLRVLVAMPNLGFCSTRNTSSHRCETACAIAHPITPPPMIKMLARSIKESRRPRVFRYVVTSLGHYFAFLSASDLIEKRLALHKFRFTPVMHGVLRALPRFVSIAPQRSAAVHSILVERVKVDVKRPQFLLVVLVVVRHARHRFQAGV